MPNQSKERNKQLDLLKLLATFAVVNLHSGTWSFADNIIEYMCGFAVPIFFMVSGALILGRSDQITKKYVFTRSFRILKLILIWSLILTIPLSAIKRTIPNPVSIFTGSLLQRVPLWQFWYMWALLFLTLCSPFIWKILQNKRSTKIYITILFFINCTISFICIYEGSMGRQNLESLVPQSMRMWSHLLYYSLGGILFRYCQIDMIKTYIQKAQPLSSLRHAIPLSWDCHRAVLHLLWRHPRNIAGILLFKSDHRSLQCSAICLYF